MAKRTSKRPARKSSQKAKRRITRTRATRQSRASKGASAKAARKTTARGVRKPTAGAPRRRSAAKTARARSLRAAGCLDLISAGEIVQAAIPNGPHDIDDTLEDAGLISDGERAVFRDDVVQRVESRGCHISSEDVPNDADTTLREARKALRDNARPA